MVTGIPEYDELKVRIEPGRQEGTYRVLAFGPEGATASGTFVLPFASMELDNFILRVGLPRRSVRSFRSSQMEEAKTFGAQLFNALLHDDHVRQAYYGARQTADARERGLRLTLHLTNVPELMEIPWEFLYESRQFLSQSIYTPVVRSLDLPTARPPRQLAPPLRILGVISSPKDLPSLDVADERRRLEHALNDLSAAGIVELIWLPRATLSELDRIVGAPDEFHVIHYIGHGAYDERTQGGLLVFEDDRGNRHEVTGEELASLLHDERSIALAVLNACEGARTSHVDPFSGVASSLVQSGIPAVVGMQFEVTDQAAVVFAERLYTALAQGYPVDAALAHARRAIWAAGNTVEFGTPVLFLRSGTALLFEIDSTAPIRAAIPDMHEQGRRVVTLDDDAEYAAAVAAFFTGRWDAAVELLARVQAKYPGEQRVTERLQYARRQKELALWSTRAEEATDQGRWSDAVDALGHLLATSPDDVELKRRLERAQVGLRIADLQADIRRLHSAGMWAAVIGAANEIAALDPAAADPDALVTNAKNELAEADLAHRYTSGLRLLDAGDWSAALETFSQLHDERPGYRDTAELLSRAHDVLAEADMSDRYAVGLLNLDAGEWFAAVEAFSQLHNERPGYRDTTALLTRAQIELYYAEGRKADELGKCIAAIRHYKAVLAADPTHRDTQARLQVCTERAALLARVQIGFYYAAGRKADELGKWSAAIRHYKAVLAADPAYGDTQVRLHACREQFERSAQQRFESAGAKAEHGKIDPKHRIIPVGQWINAVALSPDGQLLSTGSRRYVRIFRLQSGKESWKRAHGGIFQDVNSIAFSPDGKLLASAGADKTVRIWDPGKDKLVLTVHHDLGVNSVAFSPDGQRLATCSDDKTARIWDATTGEQLTVRFESAPVKSVAFSPDGKRMATGSLDNTARIWERTTGSLQLTVRHDASGIYWVSSVAFSPDGTRLAVGSSDNTARIWDATTGEQQLTVRHDGSESYWVSSVAFSPDGTRLATGSMDNTACIWDATSGERQFTVHHDTTISSVAITPDGQRLVTGSADKTVRIWEVAED
jgi:WD40 repeat protein/tetratricopeptide (TPR) repeat protein